MASLARRLRTAEQLLVKLSMAPGVRRSAPEAYTEVGIVRFSAKGLAKLRELLGLSANECGLLLGVSGQTVYKWENGKARPRAKNLPAVAALRKMGKKGARAKIEQLTRTN